MFGLWCTKYVPKHTLQTNWGGGDRQERNGGENGEIILHAGNQLEFGPKNFLKM